MRVVKTNGLSEETSAYPTIARKTRACRVNSHYVALQNRRRCTDDGINDFGNDRSLEGKQGEIAISVTVRTDCSMVGAQAHGLPQPSRLRLGV
jgi:hypothetical protein